MSVKNETRTLPVRTPKGRETIFLWPFFLPYFLARNFFEKKRGRSEERPQEIANNICKAYVLMNIGNTTKSACNKPGGAGVDKGEHTVAANHMWSQESPPVAKGPPLKYVRTFFVGHKFLPGF